MNHEKHEDTATTAPIDKKKNKENNKDKRTWRERLVKSLTKSIFHSKRSSDDNDHDDALLGDAASSNGKIVVAAGGPSPSVLTEQSFRTFQLDTPAKRWLSRFGRSDPRWQINRFFNDVAQEGARNMISENSEGITTTQAPPPLPASTTTTVPLLLQSFAKASVFTVWRPTSAVAIRRMIAGEATGKGLEIKGKSAKAGKLSGYVPFLQIYEEQHKSKVRTLPRSGRVRIFYATQEARDAVLSELGPLQNQIVNTVHEAKRIVKKTAMTGLAPIGRTISRAGAHAGAAASGIGSTLGNAGAQAGSAASGIRNTLGRAGAQAASGLGSSIGADKAMSGLKKSVGKAGSTASELGSSLSRAGGSAASGLGSSLSPAMSGLKKSVGRVIPGDMSVKGLGSTRSKRNAKEDDDEREWALKRLLWDMDDPSIRLVDDYAPKCYGIELPDRLLWQGCVADRDISRPDDSEYYTARPSQPAFQDMNFVAIWKTRKNYSSKKKKGSQSSKGGGSADDPPRVVLWQTCGSSLLADEDPMDPRGLIMAYEEDGRVLPVVSDFDCFTVGTRGVKYETPLPEEQVELLQWCLSNAEHVLTEQDASSRDSTWTSRWLDVLKASALKGFNPAGTMPRFGFGDQKSYAIMECAVSRLKENGAVRHGAECFNYFFPQELDSEFLIVSDTLPGNVPWQYVGVKELQDFLSKKIDEGFTMPLNPKWVLCDEGWKGIYDKLVSSDKPNVQDSVDVWFPPDSGVRQSIETIHARHPLGFVCQEREGLRKMSGTEAMDLATLELDQFLAFQRAKAKLRAVMSFNSLLRSVQKDIVDEEESIDTLSKVP